MILLGGFLMALGLVISFAVVACLLTERQASKIKMKVRIAEVREQLGKGQPVWVNGCLCCFYTLADALESEATFTRVHKSRGILFCVSPRSKEATKL